MTADDLHDSDLGLVCGNSRLNNLLSDQKDDPLDDQQEFVSLPDMNEGQSDDYIYGADPTL